MARTKKQAESDEAQGAPEWMVTFSDCMTLLLTFFVLLLSFASFDNGVFSDLKIIYSEALTRVTPTPQNRPRDAFSHIALIRKLALLEKGSETPTLAQELKEALMEETGYADLIGGMVFLISSKKVFWGEGKTLSREGRYIMNLAALHLKGVPGRIVVSETGPVDAQGNRYFGLPRAWVVMEYLTKNQGLNRDRCSISATGIVARDGSESQAEGFKHRTSERNVEITLLDRNTYR